MITGSGRCHGPGCTQPAVDEWCSTACEQAWNNQFHWLLGAAPAMPMGGLLSAVSAAEATANAERNLRAGLTLMWVPSPADPDAPTPAEMDEGIQIGGVLPPGEQIAATFEAVGDPMEVIRSAYERLGPIPPPPEPVRLTHGQFDALRGNAPSPDGRYWYGGPVGDLTGVPIELVDTAEESTLYRLPVDLDNSQASFVPPEPRHPHFARRYLNEFVSTGERGTEFPQVASEEPQVARGWLGRLFDRWRREP